MRGFIAGGLLLLHLNEDVVLGIALVSEGHLLKLVIRLRVVGLQLVSTNFLILIVWLFAVRPDRIQRLMR